jgi:hypothetical protein
MNRFGNGAITPSFGTLRDQTMEALSTEECVNLKREHRRIRTANMEAEMGPDATTLNRHRAANN